MPKDVTLKTPINLATPHSNSNSNNLRILRRGCLQLSNPHSPVVLIRTLLTAAIRATFRCGMLRWLPNKEVSRLKVSSDKQTPLRHLRDTRRISVQVDELECFVADVCDLTLHRTSNNLRRA